MVLCHLELYLFACLCHVRLSAAEFLKTRKIRIIKGVNHFRHVQYNCSGLSTVLTVTHYHTQPWNLATAAAHRLKGVFSLFKKWETVSQSKHVHVNLLPGWVVKDKKRDIIKCSSWAPSLISQDNKTARQEAERKRKPCIESFHR